ncbi:polysaccharide biosynthesis/export family protein [Hymenobacter sp. BT559]|jgi:polysaccharide export outer membrane protein|uniref:polysaccharide biosynthesis/export family protein n=1 Tax=Hymenobacter sp. BT559 TaxID=2795729 RepID=UPI0018EDABDC|nr:polysaccharide biosynthesis/export family protein [Hymenobacter sp. BT559]MBJ6144330.1 polysaccharide biosynthesis/export family protein [Hymenobacter sp. BT559]
MRFTHILPYILLVFVFSCTSSKKLSYFRNLDEKGDFRTPIGAIEESQIQPSDVLSITVSSLNPESNILFNNGVLATAGSGVQSTTPTRSSEGYLVDKDGNINFPVIGSIAVGGLTKAQASEKLTAALKNFVKNPIINIRFLNFKITVMGEVTRPSSFNVVSERINILEALSLAGDMTPYGKRENVLVIREKDGVRTTSRINLADKNTLSSPLFYLHQNDIVYVEPSGSRALQSSTQSFYLPIVLTALSVISIFISVLK